MRTDLDKLQGSWSVSALKLDGQSLRAPALEGATIVVEANRFRSLGMGATYEGTLKIDQTRKPRTIDMLFTAGHAIGTRHPGIYKIQSDRWTICMSTQGERRPTLFASSKGSGFALEVLTRTEGTVPKEPEEGRGPLKAAVSSVDGVWAAEDDTPQGSPTEWEGEWVMVSAVFNGGAMSQEMVKWCRRVTRGDITTVVAGPQVMLKARFRLDASTNPGGVEYLNLAGTHARKPQSGIFERRGPLLKVCVAPPKKPRPIEFSSTSGDGHSYTVWRLDKDE
jgi:uncharacterized protein (TIGR03067 family)